MTETQSQATIPAVEQAVTVPLAPAAAYELFTAGFGTWWPKEYSLADAQVDRAYVEPRAGGRCYDRCVDGSECDWGTVLAWEPPTRLVLAWQARADWTFEPDVDRASRVTVTFRPSGEGTTVSLRHDEFERHGEQGTAVADGVRGGWAKPMGLFEEAAKAAAA